MTQSWFVTGTDTGVGKTRASCALLHALACRHARCVGMKPVAAGTDSDGENDDVRALRAASNLAVPPALDNPVRLAEPVSPHIAAERAGRRIAIGELVAAYRALAERADAVVVEGAGGFCVPLTDETTGADLAVALGLPVILVVGLRLGCLNHALLTYEAIRARGLRLAGWVLNRIDPSMAEQEANASYLIDRLGTPPLADWPWQPGIDARDLAIRLPAFSNP